MHSNIESCGRSGGRGILAAFVLIAASTVDAGAAEFRWSDFLGPFHNVILHYPVGFVTMACLLELFAWRSMSDDIRRVIQFTLWLTIGSTILAAALGFARAADGGYNEQTLDAHKIYGIAVIVLAGVAIPMARIALKEGASPALRWGYRMLLLTTFSIMGLTGHKGGDLTHGAGYLTKHAPPVLRELLGEAEKPRPVAENAGQAKVGAAEPLAQADAGGAKPDLFTTVIWPAFEGKCVKCHGADKHKGDYRLDTREFALTPGESEKKPIVPGKPDESHLMALVSLTEEDEDVMPPSGKEPLTVAEKEALRRWILEGAPYSAVSESLK